MLQLLKYILTGILLTYSALSAAQPEGVSYDYLMLQLEADMKLGRIRSLRDMGSLLNQERQKLNIQQLLKDYTLFLPEEFDVNTDISKDEFLEFYYENAENIKYSELLNAFYITPVEFRSPEFSLQSFDAATVTDRALLLRQLILEYEAARKNNDISASEKTLYRIAAQRSPEAYRFLSDILRDEVLADKKYPNREQTAGLLARSVADYPVPESMNLLLSCAEKELLSPALTANLLAFLTNHLPTQRDDAAALAKEYRHLEDSIGGFERMRQTGYETVYTFSPGSFEFSVDYYGRILALSEQRPWLQHNALKDVLATKHPRALFYLAAQMYQYRDRLDVDKSEFVYRLEELTELKIAIQGRKEKSTEQNWNSDRIAQINYVTYWAAHYEDYEYDEIRNQFINKTEQLELTENYERLFRRLNSQNDSIALQAWLLLSEGDPVEVIGIANKYKELLRNYNSSLPSFKYRFLEQTVQLTDYCKRNKVRYTPSTRINHYLQKLKVVSTEKERYELENRLIASLTIDEITAVEYMGLVNENKSDFSFSVGRILDWYYSENWEKITANEKELRLYLKKAELFSELGVIGVCNHYMNKFGYTDTSLSEKLNNLLRVETDTDIIASIEYLLGKKEKSPAAQLDDFIAAPLDVRLTDKLPPPDADRLPILLDSLFRASGSKPRRVYLEYLELHADLSLVPHLMILLENNTETKRTVALLEKIYNHSLGRDAVAWLTKWENDKKNYRKWEKKFFNEKIKKVAESESTDVKILNAIMRSPLYIEKTHKPLVLNALSRLEKARDIRRFRVKQLLRMPEDLAYFENLNLTEKELDNIPRLFDLSEPAIMIAFLVKKSETLDTDAKGAFFNSMFRANWFTNYVNDGRMSEQVTTYIRTSLQTYLNDSDLISEFEEQATVRNITLLQVSNLPLREKISASLQLQGQISEEALMQIQKAILSRIDFSAIGATVRFFPDLTVLQRYNFLNQDFGLPVFDLNDPAEQQKLLQLHKDNLQNPAAFYRAYLDDFGVDYKDAAGNSDYTKIYRILKYDIVTPFVGDGGNRRDWFTYGIIKLLEYEFGTRLGFHPKLNENQTFYSYSASARASAWMRYLANINPVTAVPAAPSFNRTGLR